MYGGPHGKIAGRAAIGPLETDIRNEAIGERCPERRSVGGAHAQSGIAGTKKPRVCRGFCEMPRHLEFFSTEWRWAQSSIYGSLGRNSREQRIFQGNSAYLSTYPLPKLAVRATFQSLKVQIRSVLAGNVSGSDQACRREQNRGSHSCDLRLVRRDRRDHCPSSRLVGTSAPSSS
jgi:hypothetical protein